MAILTNLGDVPVYYLSGCSALCRPQYPPLYLPIYFKVIAPNGAEAPVENLCEGPYLCGWFAQELAAHQSVQRVLQIDGTVWEKNDEGLYCGICTRTQLEPGRYTAVATSRYSITADEVPTSPLQVEKTVAFDWP